MIIKHKYTGQKLNTNYEWWKENILNKHIECNYDVISSPNMVDVFKIKESDGKLEYIKTTGRKNAEEKYLNNGILSNYTIKNVGSGRFDNKYREISNPYANSKNQSSGFVKTQYLNKIKPIIKAIKMLSPVWKSIIGIVSMGVGGFLAYLLIELYKTF